MTLKKNIVSKSLGTVLTITDQFISTVRPAFSQETEIQMGHIPWRIVINVNE